MIFRAWVVEALKILKEAREETGLPIVTEVMGVEDLDDVCEYADMLQVGARNMQNYPLLRRLATVSKPVSAEARAFGDGQGMAAGRGIFAGGRKSQCGAVRARDQNV